MNQFKKYPNFLISFDRFFYRKEHKSTRRRILSIIVLILIALLVIYGILVATNVNRYAFLSLFTRGLRDQKQQQDFITNIGIFTLAGLSFGFAMQVKIFNIGISGQMLAGASFAFIITHYLAKAGFAPAVGGQLITIILSMFVAAFVSVLTGLFKIYLKINEVVSAILLNWIILLIVGTIINNHFIDGIQRLNGNFLSVKFPDQYSFYVVNGPTFFTSNTGWVSTIAVTAVSVVIVWVLLRFTVFGHKLKTTGLSSSSAEYFGYNKNLLQLSSFAISGALAGILGVVVYTGQASQAIDFSSVGRFGLSSVPIEGFNGIAISLIALNNPWGIVIVSMLFSLISVGQGPANLPTPQTLSLTLGVLMYIISIYGLMNYLKPWRWIIIKIYGDKNITEYQNLENNMAALSEKHLFKVKKLQKDLNEKLNKQYVSKLKVALMVLINPIKILFLKEYKEQINTYKNEYVQEQVSIVNEFYHSCVFNSILATEKVIQDCESSKNRKLLHKLSKWNKEERRIQKLAATLEDEMKTQVNKHIKTINEKISNLNINKEAR
ncbi:ABC transporter permease [Mycoplasmoides gallisepticum S6]|uniref:ABC transporter permease n=1 Tax=Mycoplasmoides gallisepticum S6 TaxID=1006581 RepID=A0A0F6CL75_MYCGL|nr:ABC transporter permease [Mycoplasmoides gallisepticum]AHB99847.1 ABC transporter permease [Mycoplasmoides gallisepticum S6]